MLKYRCSFTFQHCRNLQKIGPNKNHVTVLSGYFISLPVNMSCHPPVSSMPLEEDIAAAPADPDQEMVEVWVGRTCPGG